MVELELNREIVVVLDGEFEWCCDLGCRINVVKVLL